MSFEAKKLLKKDWVLNAEAFEKLLFNLDSNSVFQETPGAFRQLHAFVTVRRYCPTVAAMR